MSGFVLIQRDLMRHEVLKDHAPYSKREAFIDLIMGAAYEAKTVTINGQVFDLSVGDQVRSKLTLAKTWQWSRGKVERFLSLLESELMIEVSTCSTTSYITILNYQAYQQPIKRHKESKSPSNKRNSPKKTGQRTGQRIEQQTGQQTGQPRPDVQPSNDAGFEDLQNQNGTTDETTNGTTGGTTDGTQLNKEINTYIHTYNGRELKPISPDFALSADMFEQLTRLHGVPESFVFEQQLEFVTYWVADGGMKTEAQWQSGFVKRALSQWRINRGKWNETGRSVNSQRNKQSGSSVEQSLAKADAYYASLQAERESQRGDGGFVEEVVNGNR